MYVDIRIFWVLINSDEEKMFYHHWSVRAECVECECVCFYSMNIHYFRPVWSLDVAEMKMRVLEDLRIHTSTLCRMLFSGDWIVWGTRLQWKMCVYVVSLCLNGTLWAVWDMTASTKICHVPASYKKWKIVLRGKMAVRDGYLLSLWLNAPTQVWDKVGRRLREDDKMTGWHQSWQLVTSWSKLITVPGSLAQKTN